MFRLGIPIEKMKAIVVGESQHRADLRQSFALAGIDEVNGKALDVFFRQDTTTIIMELAKSGLKELPEMELDVLAENLERINFVKAIKNSLNNNDLWELEARSLDMDTLGELEPDMIAKLLDLVGLEEIGGHTVGEAFDKNRYGIVQELRNRNITDISGQDPNSFVYSSTKDEVIAKLRELGIRRIGGQSVAQIKAGTEVTTMGDIMKEFNTAGVYGAGNKSFYDLQSKGLPTMLQVLRLSGMEKIPPRRININRDQRDNIIEDLHSANIHEINGRSVEEFVVYGKTMADLIDIAHDRAPRSFT